MRLKGTSGACGRSPPRSHPASPAQPVPQAPCHAASTPPPPLLPWEVFYPNLLLGYFFFFLFSSPRPVPAHPVPTARGSRLLPSPQELFPSERQWLCLSLSSARDIPNLPHSSSPWVLSPFHIAPPRLGLPAPIVGSCPAPLSPCLSPALSPWAVGGHGWPRPCTWLLNKPPPSAACLPCGVPRARGLQTLCRGQGREPSSQGRGEFGFSLGLPPSPWVLKAPSSGSLVSPPCPSWLSAPSPCLSFPPGGYAGSTLAGYCHILLGTCQALMQQPPSWQQAGRAQHPWDVSPSSPHHTASK